jgi:hypothetical protein
MKRYIIFSLVLILIISLIAFTIQEISSSGVCNLNISKIEAEYQSYVDNPSEEKCEKIELISSCSGQAGKYMKGKCYLELYKNTGDRKYCEIKLSISQYEYSLEDFVHCLKLEGEEVRDICDMLTFYMDYKTCVTDICNEPLNLTADKCLYFDNIKPGFRLGTTCYNEYAMQIGDETYCKDYWCVENIAASKKDSNVCEILNGSYYSDCIDKISEVENTILFITSKKVSPPMTSDELDVVCNTDSNRPSFNRTYRYVGDGFLPNFDKRRITIRLPNYEFDDLPGTTGHMEFNFEYGIRFEQIYRDEYIYASKGISTSAGGRINPTHTFSTEDKLPILCAIAEKNPFICDDSDGEDYYNKGYVSIGHPGFEGRGNISDTCKGKELLEAICDEYGYLAQKEVDCTYGCREGACI